MEVLVSYDVATDTAAGRRRLRRVAQICLELRTKSAEICFRVLDQRDAV